MIVALGIIVFWWGSAGRRIAGGVMPQLTGWKAPGVPCKLFFGATVGLGALLGGAKWWEAGVVSLGAWVGHIIHGLNDSASMGRYGKYNELYSWKLHAKHWLGLGLYALGIMLAVILIRFGMYGQFPIAAIASIAGTPLVYTIAWHFWPYAKRIDGVNGNPLEAAEWFVGGILALGAFLSFAV